MLQSLRCLVVSALLSRACGYLPNHVRVVQQRQSPSFLYQAAKTEEARTENSPPLSWEENVLLVRQIQRRIATAALIGLLTSAPLVMEVPSAVAVVPTARLTATAVVAPADKKVADKKVTLVAPVPAEKKNLDDAKASLKVETARLATLANDVDKAKSEYNKATRSETTQLLKIENAGKAVETENQKLDQIKKKGERDPILAEKARVAEAKSALKQASETAKSIKTTEKVDLQKLETLQSQYKQSGVSKAKLQKSIPDLEKKYDQYQKNIKKTQEEAKKKAAEAEKKTAEAKKKDQAVEKKRVEKEREVAKQKAEQVKQKAQQVAKQKAEQVKQKAQQDKTKAEKDRKQQELETKKKQDETRKKAAQEREAKALAQKKDAEKAATQRKQAEVAAKKAAVVRAEKMTSLKQTIVKLEEQKGDLIVKDAAASKVDAVQSKLVAAKAELKQLQK